jgi:ribosomal protein L21E
MAFVDFSAQPVGIKGSPYIVGDFKSDGGPSLQVRDPIAASPGLTADAPVIVEFREPAAHVFVELHVGNQVDIDALDAGGAAVAPRRSFAGGAGAVVARFNAATPVIERLTMSDTGTETLIFTIVTST